MAIRLAPPPAPGAAPPPDLAERQLAEQRAMGGGPGDGSAMGQLRQAGQLILNAARQNPQLAAKASEVVRLLTEMTQEAMGETEAMGPEGPMPAEPMPMPPPAA